MLYRGPSPIPELCSGDLSATLQLTDAYHISFGSLCERDLVIHPMCSDAGFCSLPPSMNSQTLTDMTLSAEIALSAEGGLGQARFRASILSLSATGSSDCSEPLMDAACLTGKSERSVSLASEMLACRTTCHRSGRISTWLQAAPGAFAI